jgi:hypothetical protein
MSKNRILLYIGLFFLGISSLGFNPYVPSPWISPKFFLAFIGLAILFLQEIFSLKDFNIKIVKEISLSSFLFLAACLFFIIQRFVLISPWGETISFVAILLTLGLISLIKKVDINDKEEIVLMHFLNGIFFLQATITIIEFIFFKHFNFTMMGSSLKWRSLGLIGNPNQLALYLSLYYLRPIKHWWNFKYGKTLTFLISGALLLTFSRGVYLALFISYLSFSKIPLKKNILRATLSAALIIGIIFSIEFYWQKTGILNIDSVSGRILSFESFVNEYTFNIQDFLIGTGNFEINSPIHNQYLYLFKSTGIIGLLLYALILISLRQKNALLVIMIAIFSIYDLPLFNPAFIFGSIVYFLYLKIKATLR